MADTNPAAPVPTRSAARLLVDCLIAQECDRIFTVPGESFLPVLDALYDTPAIDLVTCRQEGGAAFMAAADGTITGRPGVAMVTRGPGATNAAIGVHVAMQDSLPMILFVGDVARNARDREGFQELDVPAVFGPMAKWAARIDDPARVPEYVARAYATAISGRPGPVVLALPEDMLADAVPANARPRPAVVRPAQAPCPDAMGALMALLEDAAAPIAIIGGAGWNARARQHFQRFAERIGLPVATAFRRQDAISNDSAIYAGTLGYGTNPALAARVRDADLLLVVGARLGEATTDGYTLITPDHPGQCLVHVHPDPAELGRVYCPDLALCADMGEFAETADLWDEEAVTPYAASTQAHEEWRRWSTPPSARTGSGNGGDDRPELDLATCVAAMRGALPADAVMCNGAGNFAGWWHRFWPYVGFPAQLAPTAGAMGYGLPAAIAAARRLPNRCVVALAGDGDFLMNGQELATAAALDLDLLIVVVDNGTYGTIRMHQEHEFPGRVVGTTLANPDFAALAKAFGAQARRIDSTAAFAAALADMKELRGLRLIHCVAEVDPLTAAGATVSSLNRQR